MRDSVKRLAIGGSILVAALLAGSAAAGPIHLRPYFDADKSEVILVWDEATGKSKSWYYDKAEKKFAPSGEGFQLPANPGITTNVMMAPYLGPDGSEVILVWDKKTGKSVSWYYSEADKKFVRAEAAYQLPPQKGKEVMLAPYLDSQKSEVVLVWDAATGKSNNWYFDEADKKFKLSEPGYQLPASLGLKGRIMMLPYRDKQGSEVIQTWSVTDGKSVNWYFDEADRKMKASEDGFQLPVNPGVSKEVWMVPYIDGEGTEVMLVWSSSTGQSVNWYVDNADKSFKKSDPGYQLPQKPITAKTFMIVPYLDTDASEILLVWDAATGASKSFYYDTTEKKMKPAAENYQLPANPLK